MPVSENRLIFKNIERMVRRQQEWRTERMMKELHSCGSNVIISPDARIWGTHAVTLEDEVVINAFSHIFGGGGVRGAVGRERSLRGGPIHFVNPRGFGRMDDDTAQGAVGRRLEGAGTLGGLAGLIDLRRRRIGDPQFAG